MLRLFFIILPFFAPTILYVLYRRVRYGGRLAIAHESQSKQSKQVTIYWLLGLGLLLVVLNILFLVQFDGQPAEQSGYRYPQFSTSPPVENNGGN